MFFLKATASQTSQLNHFPLQAPSKHHKIARRLLLKNIHSIGSAVCPCLNRYAFPSHIFAFQAIKYLIDFNVIAWFWLISNSILIRSGIWIIFSSSRKNRVLVSKDLAMVTSKQLWVLLLQNQQWLVSLPFNKLPILKGFNTRLGSARLPHHYDTMVGKIPFRSKTNLLPSWLNFHLLQRIHLIYIWPVSAKQSLQN